MIAVVNCACVSCANIYICIIQLPVYAVVIMCLLPETDAAEQKDLQKALSSVKVLYCNQ